jgi:hypothetical protein
MLQIGLPRAEFCGNMRMRGHATGRRRGAYTSLTRTFHRIL